MRTLTLACLVLLSGCSLVVRPNPRLLFTDGGEPMGDAGPMPQDDSGNDAAITGSCAAHPVGSIAPVITSDCGFYATQLEVINLRCQSHDLSGRLTFSCDHTYMTQVITSDATQVDCDGSTFLCNTVLGADGALRVACSTPSTGATCSIVF